MASPRLQFVTRRCHVMAATPSAIPKWKHDRTTTLPAAVTAELQR
jgi:hypothetical protein